MIRIDELYYNVFVKAVQRLSRRAACHWFYPFGSTDFQDMCNGPLILDADLRIVFWDQEPAYQDRVSTFMDQYIPRYKDAQDRIIVTSELESQDLAWACNTYGLRSGYYFFHGWAALDWYRGYDHSFLAQDWQNRTIRKRLFCPNNIIGGRRSHRLRVLSALAERDAIADNHISFPAVCPYENLAVADLCHQHNITLPENLCLPLVIDQEHNHANDSHCINFWDQATESFCHIVTETVYDSTRIHLTEKTFKPIVLEQPFLLVAPRGSLRYLRSYGFRTFGDLWNEGYDDLDDDSRIAAIADIAAQVNQWTVAELRDAQHHATDIVRHNKKWFYGGFQDLLWTELTGLIDSWH